MDDGAKVREVVFLAGTVELNAIVAGVTVTFSVNVTVAVTGGGREEVADWAAGIMVSAPNRGAHCSRLMSFGRRQLILRSPFAPHVGGSRLYCSDTYVRAAPDLTGSVLRTIITRVTSSCFRSESVEIE